MKIGINSRMLQEGRTGIPNYLLRLYSEMIDSYSTCCSYFFFQTSREKYFSQTDRIIQDRFSLPKNGVCNVLFDVFFVLYLIWKNNIDLYHAPANILPLFRIRGVKYVVTVHDLSFKIFPENHSWLFNRYYSFFLKRSLKIADGILAVSEHTKKDIMKFYNVPSERIRVVHLGVDHEFFAGAPHEEPIIKEPYVFSVTTHPRRKNIINAVRAFARIPELNDVKYVIAGVFSEDQRQELIELVRVLGIDNRVQLFGFAKDNELRNLYRHALLFVFPSLYEGFGLPVIEAVASGSLVLTSRSSSLVELLPDDACYVDPMSIDSIVHVMRRLVTLNPDERKTLIERNRSFIQIFDWNHTAKQVHLYFHSIDV